MHPSSWHLNSECFSVDCLSDVFGKSEYPSPLKDSIFQLHEDYKGTMRIPVDLLRKTSLQTEDHSLTFELAGPREKLFWNPTSVVVAIVTCGGLAPGLNNVIQNLVTILCSRYKVEKIYGVPYGYYGFSHDKDTHKFRFSWHRLDTTAVQNIDFEAGSVLGTGRGHSDPQTIVDALTFRGVDLLFTIGGDGTLAGAAEIYEEIKRRQLPIGLIGIPKTIDNDVLWVSKTFGFESAVGKAVEALRCAQAEARSTYNGVGIVKIMGRNSGALAATASMALNGIDFVLIPEVPLVIDGEHGFLNIAINKVLEKGHITIAVAEGAGQDLFPEHKTERDASGNVKLKDIGILLKEKIAQEFVKRGIEYNIKYIDPSYILRAQPTSTEDSVFCAYLSQNAAHAAMAGKTGCMIGYHYGHFTLVPLKTVSLGKKCVDVQQELWGSVLAATGQPSNWK